MKFVSVMTSSGRGGAEFAAVSMLDALIEGGHDAVMLSDQPDIATEIGVPSRPIDLGEKLSTRTYKRLGLTWPGQLLRLRAALLAEAPFDVLIVHYKKEQLLASMLPRTLRPTLLWAEWGPVPFPMRRGAPRLAYLAAARGADAVMAVSAGTRDSVCAVGVPESKVAVVPNAVRPEQIVFSATGRERIRAQLGIPPDAFVVGCVSRLHPKKRNDVVVDAVTMLDRETHLIMAGDGETEADLREQARALGGRAHFIPTPAGTIDQVLSAFDVSVFCPSPTEGAPRAVILGMLTERPCLATGAEGVADMIGSEIGGITVPENDPRALADLIEPYLRDRGRAARQGEAARRFAIDRYGPRRVAARIEELVAGSARTSRASRRARPPMTPSAGAGAPMKFVSVMTSGSQGGGEYAALWMLDALVDRGHAGVMLTDQPEIGRGTGVHTESVALGPKLSMRTYLRLGATWPLQLWRLRAALAAQLPYDVLVVHYKKEQMLASMLPRRLRPTLVWAEWGPLPYPMRTGLPRRAYLAAARRAQAVLAVSSGTRKSICDTGVPCDKVTVVPNAVRPETIRFLPDARVRLREELGIPEDALVVGCISRLHPKKRNDVVIEAVRTFDEPVHLIIAGDGETERQLREQAAPLGERAHFLPAPGERIAEVLSAIDVSVFCPSPTEGAPLAVVLAMFAERPCLATGSEGVEDMIDAEVGAITEPENDPAALAGLIRAYLDDPALLPAQGSAARRRAVERSSAANVGRRIEAIVEAVR